ncbi:cyclase family protein [Halobellus sp. GM3]|uniref:cyclase family protein n=1 Tax=Halobellus sp. GM3 TaxID=3458410 RepID=UPI00403DB61D
MVDSLDTQEWIDLSITVDPTVPKMPVLPCPEFERVSEQSETSLQVTNYCLTTHIGTHVDAPSHAIADGDPIDELAVDRFVTTAHVVAVDADPLQAIDVDDVAPALKDLDSGDAVIVRAGWEDHAKTETYHEHPYFTPDLAEWFVEQGVDLVGMDFLTPDMPPSERPEGFDYPIHTTLLDDDVIILENLSNTADLVGETVTLLVAPIKLGDADGAPVRAMASKPSR